jgi:hypothetical protein
MGAAGVGCGHQRHRFFDRQAHSLRKYQTSPCSLLPQTTGTSNCCRAHKPHCPPVDH